MTGEQIIFLIVGAVTLIDGFLGVTVRNLVHAALWLVATLFGVAIIYTLLNAGFLAVVQVVVYIGAIAILFIFVVMLTRRDMRDQGPAHHGVAGVGAAALEGPGPPVESGSSAVLPEGKTLLYAKLDHAKFKTYDSAAVESDYSQFWMVGLGHGFTPWFSAYVFAPYNIKKDEPGGFKSKGWANISVMGQVGFKYRWPETGHRQ